jgi:hypothetical protein
MACGALLELAVTLAPVKSGKKGKKMGKKWKGASTAVPISDPVQLK